MCSDNPAQSTCASSVAVDTESHLGHQQGLQLLVFFFWKPFIKPQEREHRLFPSALTSCHLQSNQALWTADTGKERLPVSRITFLVQGSELSTSFAVGGYKSLQPSTPPLSHSVVSHPPSLLMGAPLGCPPKTAAPDNSRKGGWRICLLYTLISTVTR